MTAPPADWNGTNGSASQTLSFVVGVENDGRYQNRLFFAVFHAPNRGFPGAIQSQLHSSRTRSFVSTKIHVFGVHFHGFTGTFCLVTRSAILMVAFSALIFCCSFELNALFAPLFAMLLSPFRLRMAEMRRARAARAMTFDR